MRFHTVKRMLIVAFFSACASAQEVYSSPHQLLVDAIKNGSSSGMMIGPTADLFTRQFKSSGPLMVTATVVQSLPQKDCKRLQVVYTKHDVDTPKGKTEAVLRTHINYCLDGSPPGVEAGK